MNTIIVNLWGAPGAGKSTLAAYVFSKLKMNGVNCELITEFAKDKVWEDNATALADQVYVLGQQNYRVKRCLGKVDVLITDSPIGLSPLYNGDPELDKPMRDLVFALNRKYNNVDFFVNRVKKYNPVGRIHTETESDRRAVEIKEFMRSQYVNFIELDGDLISADVIMQIVMEKLKNDME